jgi:hypothetical protein
MKQAIFGIAESEDQAVSIFNQLLEFGFSDNDISALFPDPDETRHFAHEQHSKAPEGAAAGAGTGGVIGGALGFLVSVGALTIPGVGAFIAAGPIMGALAGAAAGGAMGGLTGALIGIGMPEFEAKQYVERMKGGNILISVHTEDGKERARVKEIFKNADAVTAAEDVVDRAYEKPSAPGQSGVSSFVRKVRDPFPPEPDPTAE